MRTKRISLLVALVFLIGAMTLPMTAFAAGGKDTTPPTLTAVLDGETVKIVSSDDNSGVEAVYIDKTRVNSLVDGKASVALKDYAGTDKKVSVYAVDYAGNRSDAVQFDNPYYKEPVSTEKPAAPTQPSQSSTPATKPVQTQAASSGSTGTQSSSSNTGTDSGGTSSQDGSSGSTGNSGTPEPTTSSVPEGAFTPEGTGTVLDSATGEDGDKQFYTITTEAGNVFYLIIDGKRDDNNVSFTAANKGDAPVLELKWDTSRKVYTLTVTDTNNLNIDLQMLSGSGVTVSRNGNQYTFTSKNMIMEPVSFEFRKDIPVANDMLIWGRPGYQTMMTGASDPVSFFMNIKTETYGTAKIVKTSEDGIVSGISFRISGTDILGNEVNETVTTGDNGQVEKKFLPGTYLVTEIPVDRYVTPSAQYITIESGQTASVHFSNILKKFRVHVVKSDADTGTAQGDARGGQWMKSYGKSYRSGRNKIPGFPLKYRT